MPPQDAPRPEDRKTARIARINDLSQLARTAWFSLLGYLVFVGITLLGVKDADFFVPSRQTRLPLVGVDIPTASFFWIAPVLGAALYTYLHLFLIKLWDAHAEARTTDADATHHWLVGDFVLLRQHDPTTGARPLAWLTDWIARLLVWAAGPIVLAYAWWRSMPAHNEWLTLLIAACLWLTLVVGFTSWWRAEERLGRLPQGHWSTGAGVPSAGLAALLLVATSWLRTEGGLDNYADGFWTLDDVSFAIPADTPVVRWFTDEPLLLPLARTDLTGEELVPLPDDWEPPEEAIKTYREAWCRREGLTMAVCDHYYEVARPIPEHVVRLRADWCTGKYSQSGCSEYFGSLNNRFMRDWWKVRIGAIEALGSLDLKFADLRSARADGTSLVGADLAGARLQRSGLLGANLEGASLVRSNLRGARLDWAMLRFADLRSAQLSGAELQYVHLEHTRLQDVADLRGANLTGARMTAAELEGLPLDDVNLDFAQLESANLRETRLSDTSMVGVTLWGADLSGADLRGARLRGDFRFAWFDGADFAGAQIDGIAHGADLRGARTLTQSQLDSVVGDDSTLLPVVAGQSLHVWSCWPEPPEGYAEIVSTMIELHGTPTGIAQFEKLGVICPAGGNRRPTGTPLPRDAPYPPGPGN